VIQQELPYRQSKIKEKEQESPLGTQMWNVIIATKGHMSKDCWAKGGGKEGQGPKGWKGPNRNKSNQAQEANSSLNEVLYMAYGTREINQFDWIFNTGSTSHICMQRDAFIDYYPLQNSTITRIGPMPATAMGKGTMMVHMSINRQTIPH
jgi:hypothetical protein